MRRLEAPLRCWLRWRVERGPRSVKVNDARRAAVNPSRARPSSYCGHIAAEKCDEASSSARIERTAGMKPTGSFVRSQGLARGRSEACLVHP